MTRVSVDLAILASAVIVLGGLAALVRALLRIRDTIRDNTKATAGLTERLDEFVPIANGRMERLERALLRMWARLFPGEPPPA